MQKLENIVKSAVNFDSQRGDKVDVVNIPFETDKAMPITTEKPAEGWIVKIKEFRGSLKYTFLVVFLVFSFLFVVRPLINWLTSTSLGDVEIIKQLPKTVGEIEREYGARESAMPHTAQVTDLITSDKELSMGVMQDWLQEKE
jgi:flagellar M-ring protein FliF